MLLSRFDAESARIPHDTSKDFGGDALEVHLFELFASGRLRRLNVEEEDDEHDGDAAERQVEVKEPPPLAGRGEGAANRRTDGRGERPHAADDSKVRAPLREWDEVADDDLDHGEDCTSADALDRTTRDRHRHRLRRTGQSAPERKDDQAAQHDRSPAKDVGQAAGCNLGVSIDLKSLR